MSLIRLLCSLLLVTATACEGGGAPSSVFIAIQSDFAPYATWEEFPLGVAMNGGHPVGVETAFRNAKPAAGAYPVGTILVKEIQAGDLPQQWELFGMVKRGGAFNAAGAKGWEFFTLKLNLDLVPIVVSRGSNPADADSQGHGYGGDGSSVTCNRCHGVAGTEASDHTLSAALHP